MSFWIIRNTLGEGNEVWSNEDGWVVGFENATRFTKEQRDTEHLPFDGKWEEIMGELDAEGRPIVNEDDLYGCFVPDCAEAVLRALPASVAANIYDDRFCTLEEAIEGAIRQFFHVKAEETA